MKVTVSYRELNRFVGLGLNRSRAEASAARRVARLLLERFGYTVHFMSGYTKDELDIRAVSEGRVSFIEKPFSADDLVTAVRNALGTT